MQNICVYCASSTQIDQKYFDAADRLGRILAKEGIRIICGGGSLGLMAQLSDSALAAGGEVTGIIPRFIATKTGSTKDLPSF